MHTHVSLASVPHGYCRQPMNLRKPSAFKRVRKPQEPLKRLWTVIARSMRLETHSWSAGVAKNHSTRSSSCNDEAIFPSLLSKTRVRRTRWRCACDIRQSERTFRLTLGEKHATASVNTKPITPLSSPSPPNMTVQWLSPRWLPYLGPGHGSGSYLHSAVPSRLLIQDQRAPPTSS